METIKLNYVNMMSGALKDRGIDQKKFLSSCDRAVKAYFKVEEGRGKNMQGWMDSPYISGGEIEEIKNLASRVRKDYEYFVLLGIGGSALGSVALFYALKHLYHNELSKKERKGAPKFYCIDNADPEKMQAFLDVIDIKKTAFCVITKSGSTSETMSQYLIVKELLEKTEGCESSKQIICITSKDGGSLIKIAKLKGYSCLYIPQGVGGRFSVLSAVGLFPAAVLGIDIEKLLQGAKDMDKFSGKDFNSNMPLQIALLHILAMERGINITVLMPYAEKLKYMADWFCQLWAESLGKAFDNKGVLVNCGQTPVKALGVTDQHSQIQLYTQGPYDKIVMFLESGFEQSAPIPKTPTPFEDVNFLCGHTLSRLMSCEMEATKYALNKSGRMNLTLTLPKTDEYYLGQLFYMFMLQTAYAAQMLSIDAYDQPGVEEGKKAAYALLGRKGYEALLAELSGVINDKK